MGLRQSQLKLRILSGPIEDNYFTIKRQENFMSRPLFQGQRRCFLQVCCKRLNRLEERKNERTKFEFSSGHFIGKLFLRQLIRIKRWTF